MFEEIVGSSPALKTVLSGIVKVAPTDSTVQAMYAATPQVIQNPPDYTGETSADSLITSSQVIITASEIREIVLR
jgi:hypothetical protein